jgi:hypothetical protein
MNPGICFIQPKEDLNVISDFTTCVGCKAGEEEAKKQAFLEHSGTGKMLLSGGKKLVCIPYQWRGNFFSFMYIYFQHPFNLSSPLIDFIFPFNTFCFAIENIAWPGILSPVPWPVPFLLLY